MPRPKGLCCWIQQIFKRNEHQSFKDSWIIKGKTHVSINSMRPTVFWYPNQTHIIRKLFIQSVLEITGKILNKRMFNQIQSHKKAGMPYIQVRFILGIMVSFSFQKHIYLTQQTSRFKDPNQGPIINEEEKEKVFNKGMFMEWPNMLGFL